MVTGSAPAEQPWAPAERSRAESRPVPVLLVTGMSGAGHTSALRALEDMGYEAVDNLPLSLLPSLVRAQSAPARPLAIGVDIRTRDFGVQPFLDEIDAMMRAPGIAIRMIFLDCEDEVLRRRYSETRRRHPLAADRPVLDGIRHERRMVSPLRSRADLVIDTSMLSLGDLQRHLHGHFNLEQADRLAVFVTSFSYRHGLPREADLVFDVRFLDNPHYSDVLRPQTGRDAAVAEFIAKDPDFPAFFDSLTGLMGRLLPRYRAEGKSYLTVAVGCTGGRHRSVFVAEKLTEWLRMSGWGVSLSHRDMMRQRTS